MSKAVYPEGEEIFEYDNAGNRIKRIMKDVTVKYSYDRRNRLIEKIEGGMQTSYRYDLQGNLIEEEGRRGTTRYTYDCFNRTESVRTAEGGYIRNRYDPEGLRYELYENGKVNKGKFATKKEAVEAYKKNMEEFEKLKSMAKNELDFSTDPNGAVFWSGNNMLLAQRWAKKNGKTTLE